MNWVQELNGFRIVGISALTLEYYHNDPASVNETLSFLQTLNASSQPTILMTHVPLWRPDNSPCGGKRVQPNLVDRIGISYTNMLPKNLTELLLEQLKPIHVFSGDDHDVCHYTHPQGTKEVSLAIQ